MITQDKVHKIQHGNNNQLISWWQENFEATINYQCACVYELQTVGHLFFVQTLADCYSIDLVTVSISSNSQN